MSNSACDAKFNGQLPPAMMLHTQTARNNETQRKLRCSRKSSSPDPIGTRVPDQLTGSELAKDVIKYSLPSKNMDLQEQALAWNCSCTRIAWTFDRTCNTRYVQLSTSPEFALSNGMRAQEPFCKKILEVLQHTIILACPRVATPILTHACLQPS